MFKYAGRVPALTYIKTNDGAHTYFFITVSRKSAALLRLKNTACELFTGIALKIAGSCAMHIAVLTKEFQQTADTGSAKMLLAEIAVLCSYIKRRKHLTLLTDRDIRIAVTEIQRAFNESLQTLKLLGVHSSLYVDSSLYALRQNGYRHL